MHYALVTICLESSTVTKSKREYFVDQANNYGSYFFLKNSLNHDILSLNCSLKMKYFYELLICDFIELIIKCIFSYPVNIRCEFHKDRWVSFDATVDA